MGLRCCSQLDRQVTTFDLSWVEGSDEGNGVRYKEECYGSIPNLTVHSSESHLGIEYYGSTPNLTVHSSQTHFGIECFESMPNMKINSTKTDLRDSTGEIVRHIKPSPRGPSHPNHSRSNGQPSRRPRMKERNCHPHTDRTQVEDEAKPHTDASNYDMQTVEVDTNETNFKLKGTKNLRGKFGNLVRRNSTNVYGISFKDDSEPTKLRRSQTVPVECYSSSRKRIKQHQIKMGIKLSATMDFKVQQQDLSLELLHQEGHINKFHTSMDRVHEKILYQTDIVSSILVA